MRGAALYFIKKAPALKSYDGLITTDLMSLSDFKALAKNDCPPALVYFHENQLTYPLAPGEHTDYQFGFTDITTALAADRILFNSRTHSDAFFKGLPGFLKMMPEYRPHWVADEIRAKAGVLYPGCRFAAGSLSLQDIAPESPPLIIWNHRWEFDKNPRPFFEALDRIDESGLDFQVALLGENLTKIRKHFLMRWMRCWKTGRNFPWHCWEKISRPCPRLLFGLEVVTAAESCSTGTLNQGKNILNGCSGVPSLSALPLRRTSVFQWLRRFAAVVFPCCRQGLPILRLYRMISIPGCCTTIKRIWFKNSPG